MTEFKVTIGHKTITPDERSRRLAQAYQLILSWPDPGEIKTEPAGILCGDAAGSEGGTPAQTAIALILPPVEGTSSNRKGGQ
jgi:hypothetical protein